MNFAELSNKMKQEYAESKAYSVVYPKNEILKFQLIAGTDGLPKAFPVKRLSYDRKREETHVLVCVVMDGASVEQALLLRPDQFRLLTDLILRKDGTFDEDIGVLPDSSGTSVPITYTPKAASSSGRMSFTAAGRARPLPEYKPLAEPLRKLALEITERDFGGSRNETVSAARNVPRSVAEDDDLPF
jgi:hypothetical protein